MGTLTLPARGLVYVDANAIIYRIETIQPYFDAAQPLWDALDARLQAVITSEMSLLEVLVKPLRLGDTMLQSLFLGTLYGTPGFFCRPIDRQNAPNRSGVAGYHRAETPDSIHAATALRARCTLFVTNDAAFRRVPGLPVAILSEIAAAPSTL